MKPPRSPSQGELDLDKIRALADELGSPDPALRFLTKYLSMLPHRVKRIVTAVEQGDAEETTIAVLSLKVSSFMVGAVDTETQCRALEMMIRNDRFDDATRALPALRHTTDACTAAQRSIVAAAHTTLTRPGRFHQS